MFRFKYDMTGAQRFLVGLYRLSLFVALPVLVFTVFNMSIFTPEDAPIVYVSDAAFIGVLAPWLLHLAYWCFGMTYGQVKREVA